VRIASPASTYSAQIVHGRFARMLLPVSHPETGQIPLRHYRSSGRPSRRYCAWNS